MACVWAVLSVAFRVIIVVAIVCVSIIFIVRSGGKDNCFRMLGTMVV